MHFHKNFCWTPLSVFVFLLFSFASPCQAQKLKPVDFGIKSKKALGLYLEGKMLGQRREHRRAIEAFESALELEPNFSHAHHQLGVSAYFMGLYTLANHHLEQAYQLDPEENGGYYLAETYFRLMEYEQAISQYEKFLIVGTANRKIQKTAQVNLRKAKFAVQHLQDSIQFVPQNLGPAVNSAGDDYLPYMPADESLLLFTSRRAGSTGGYNSGLRDYGEDFFVSEWKKDAWLPAKNLGAPVNTERNEGAASLSQDGRLLLFTICNHPEGLGRCDIFFSTKKGDKWTEARNIGEAINSPAWESQPFLSHDGQTLYFVSDRKGGKGGRDIWFSELSGGHWSTAKNLTGPVNTSGNEGAPYLHADGISFYFASDAHPGFGAMDLFVCYQSDSGWTEPKNLGYPLNTVNEEANIFINTKGNKGFINSTRPGGLGKSDIYSFDLDERIRPQIATFLRGITRDSLTQEPLRSKVTLVDLESGDTLRTQFSDALNGEFLMSLPLDRSYAALVETPGYLFASKHFFLKGLEEDTYFDLIIDLLPIKEGAQVVLNNVFFDTGKWDLKSESYTELDVLWKYLTQNPQLKIELQGHTDDVGADADNLTLSQRRADAVKTYLIEKGIPKERLLAKGYGESQPIVDNNSDESRAINRRTEFKILEGVGDED
ncbi:MAG: OmpA family protein [Bacteroidota bacterium]